MQEIIDVRMMYDHERVKFVLKKKLFFFKEMGFVKELLS